MTNILKAITNIITHNNFEIRNTNQGRNRANSVGEALELYLKDAFAGTLGDVNTVRQMHIFNQYFSWLGNQNNPPDFMIRGGDAIEVKKTQSANAAIALNSSHPKAILHSTSPLITEDCQNCETWTSKDLIYCVGHTSDTHLKSLWMVYGSIYAANSQTYVRIKETITNGINSLNNVEFAETKELGRVNRVDPLGITSLRIRGMWQIKNPRKVFDYLYETQRKPFELIVIIPTSKYNTFPEEVRREIESSTFENFNIEEREVKNPNNPANLIPCKLITYHIN